MSATYDTILNDMKTAMKSKDVPRLQLLRSLKARIFEKEISQRKGDNVILSDDQVHEVLMKAAKQRKDSMAQFRQAGREDLAETEKFELTIIESYLPELLSEQEIKNLAEEAIRKTGASSISDIGKVMGVLMPRIKGKVDGSLVNRVVRELLGQL